MIPTPTDIAPTQTNVTITQGQTTSVDVDVNFSGGAGDAGIVFTSITCAVSPTAGAPACSVSSPTLSLDGNGDGTVRVTVKASGSATLLAVPQSDRRLVPLFASSIVLSGLALVLLSLGFSEGRTHKSAHWGFALLLLTVLIMLSTNACKGASSPTALSGSYTVTVTAHSVTPALQASGSFGVTVVAPPGVFHP